MYGQRTNGGQHGSVHTKKELVDNMLDIVGYNSNANLSKVRICEPSAGNGAFALEIIKRLYASSEIYKFNFTEALSNLAFYEIDEIIASELETNIKKLLSSLHLTSNQKLIYREDFLLSTKRECDIVIGNPPYVRHENIPLALKSKYKEQFGTFKHRSDLYIPFFEKGLSLLSNQGLLCFLCSNRWLKNQYGKNLRHLIGVKYHLSNIINLEKTNPFLENVIAYPAICTIKGSVQNEGADYYEVEDLNFLPKVVEGTITPLRKIQTSGTNWFIDNSINIGNSACYDLIEKQGFSIGIGVATGNDKIYIKKDFEGKVEEQLLLPILTSKDLRGDKLEWQGNYILNPFTKSGQLIDLEKYPKAKAYLIAHADTLKKRHVSRKNPAHWFKTIDKINADLISKPKIILPDISGNKYIFIDNGKYYPHHNLYYITGKSIDSLKVLAAILLSDRVRQQLLEIGNKMNGGYPRWQSQNLRKLRVPIISSLSKDVFKKIIVAYDNKDIGEINNILNDKNIEKEIREAGQLNLFEPKSIQ
jgi:adenine-specific DNA-methyltransferase